MTTYDFRDGRGPVPAHRHANPDGSVGGWVEDNCDVSSDSTVSDGSTVSGSTVSDGSTVSGSTVSGSTVSGSTVSGSTVSGSTVSGSTVSGSTVSGSTVSGELRIGGEIYAGTPAERAAAYRLAHPDVPVVEHLDARILAFEEARPGSIFMGSWHSDEEEPACSTTHCRAGTAIHIAGEAGYEYEARVGSSEMAGVAIYAASTGSVPDFFATTEAALVDIRRCAALDPVPT